MQEYAKNWTRPSSNIAPSSLIPKKAIVVFWAKNDDNVNQNRKSISKISSGEYFKLVIVCFFVLELINHNINMGSKYSIARIKYMTLKASVDVSIKNENMKLSNG